MSHILICHRREDSGDFVARPASRLRARELFPFWSAAASKSHWVDWEWHTLGCAHAARVQCKFIHSKWASKRPTN